MSPFKSIGLVPFFILCGAILCAIVPPVPARADAGPYEEPNAPVRAVPTAGSDASFDKRLPPVLPGETVADSGQTMKVWSTGGGLPALQAPQEPQAPLGSCRKDIHGAPLGECGEGSAPLRGDVRSGIGVIVDQRSGDSRPGSSGKGE